MSYPRIWSGMRMDGATGAQSGPTGKTKYFQEVNRFRYDDNGRLTHVSLNNAEFEQIKPQDGSGNSELTTIGAGDRLLEADGYSYRYDAEGNVIQRVYNVATKDRLIIDNTKVQSGKTSLAFDDPGTTATGSYTPEPSIAPTQREYRGTAGFFAITDFFAKAKFFDVTPGSYDLWATWKPVTDGALGKFDVRAKRDTDVANVISTGNVDFKLQPNDFIDEAGIRWQKAATIQVKDRDELHVILKKVDIRAAGAIVFDAIQLTPTVVKETYTWDHRNQLAKTTQFNLGGQKTTEVLQNIDAGGRLLSTKTTQFNPRTGAVNSQQTMQHIHDGMNRIADVKVGVAASDAKLNNVYLVDNHGTTLAVNAITPTKAQAANWYFYDTVGAARSVASNESGWNLIHRVMTVQGTVDRTIGDWRKGNITDSPVIWKGAIQTPITRTYVIGGRTYDSTMNRYLSEDSLAAPGSTNRYIVADNNPLASLTPADSLKGTGKSWESQYLKAFSQSYAYYFNPANNWNSGTWEGKIFGGVQYLAWGSAAVAGVGIGAAGLAPALGTAGGLSLALGGAGAGAINTYVYNPDANFVEYAMGVGFGGLNPIGEAISVGGGVVGAGIAGARGGSARTGYQIGSTITGLLGAGVDDYFRAVGKMIQAGGAVNRAAAARHAMAFSGASAGMGAAGAALGYQVGGA